MPTSPSSTRQAAGSVPLADRVLFCAILAILAVRPMIGESFERVDIGFLESLPAAGGPTPATTAWLDAALLAASSIALVRKRRRGGRGVVVGAVLLVAGGAVSSLAASDRFLAAFEASSLCIGVAAGLALASLLRGRWMLHVLLAAILATGATTAVKCIRQRTTELSDALQYWQQELKPTLLQRGYQPDDPLLVNYERRILSQEPQGFLSHPNVTGSGLMLALLVAAGVLIGQVARTPLSQPSPRGEQSSGVALAVLLGAALCALLAGGLWLSHAQTAIGCAVLGLAGLVWFGFAGAWIARHRVGVAAALLGGYLALIAAGVSFGIVRGTLPHPSLAFRWQYWTTAVRALADAPWTGIGRGGFATAYMRYKPAEGTEEVRDPHDLWLSLLVEMGPLGLIGGAALAAGCVIAGLRRLDQRAQLSGATGHQGQPEVASGTQRTGKPRLPLAPDLPLTFHRSAVLAIPVAAGVLGLHGVSSATDFTAFGLCLIWLADIAAVWLLALGVGLWLLWRLAPGSGTQWLVASLLAAVLAAFGDSLLGFTLMTPGGLAVFVLCASGLGGTNAEETDGETAVRRRHGTWQVAAGLTAAALCLGHVWAIAWPLEKVAREVGQLQDWMRGQPAVTAPTLIAAAGNLADPATPDVSARRLGIRTLLQVCRAAKLDGPTRMRLLLDTEKQASDLAAAHPDSTNHHVLLAQVREALAAEFEAASDDAGAREWRQQAADAWDRAVECYPTNPRTRISAGSAWQRVWQDTGNPEPAKRARQHWEEALRIDDTRKPEEVVRLRPGERQTATSGLQQLPASAPATQPITTPKTGP